MSNPQNEASDFKKQSTIRKNIDAKLELHLGKISSGYQLTGTTRLKYGDLGGYSMKSDLSVILEEIGDSDIKKGPGGAGAGAAAAAFIYDTASRLRNLADDADDIVEQINEIISDIGEIKRNIAYITRIIADIPGIVDQNVRMRIDEFVDDVTYAALDQCIRTISKKKRNPLGEYKLKATQDLDRLRFSLDTLMKRGVVSIPTLEICMEFQALMSEIAEEPKSDLIVEIEYIRNYCHSIVEKRNQFGLDGSSLKDIVSMGRESISKLQEIINDANNNWINKPYLRKAIDQGRVPSGVQGVPDLYVVELVVIEMEYNGQEYYAHQYNVVKRLKHPAAYYNNENNEWKGNSAFPIPEATTQDWHMRADYYTKSLHKIREYTKILPDLEITLELSSRIIDRADRMIISYT